MSMATIAGNAYDILTQGAQEQAPRKIGQRRESWNGGFRSGEIAYKKRWALPLAPITEAAYQTLRANVLYSAIVTCNGDFTNNIATSCVVDIVSAVFYRPSTGTGMYRMVTLDILEN